MSGPFQNSALHRFFLDQNDATRDSQHSRARCGDSSKVLRLLQEPRYSELIKNPLMLTLLISLSTAVNANPDLPYTKAGLYETAIAQLLHKSSLIKFGMRRAVVDKKIESITRTLASKTCYNFLAHLAWNLHSDRVRDVAPERVTKLVHEHLFSIGRPSPEDDATTHVPLASNSAPDAGTLFDTVATFQTAVAYARCPLFAVSNTVQVDGDDGEERIKLARDVSYGSFT